MGVVSSEMLPPLILNPASSSRMSRQRRRDTAPELAIRRLLHARGLRFRVDLPLPGLLRGRADLTFPTRRLVVFVDGCFWHGCPEHGTQPRANGAWWAAKLQRNADRDRAIDEQLAALGWTVIRIWEHEQPELAADRVEVAVRGT